MEKQMSHKICNVNTGNHCGFSLTGKSAFFCAFSDQDFQERLEEVRRECEILDAVSSGINFTA
jgi:hypothetical protein